MLRVHGDSTFSKSQNINREGLYDKEELEEMEANWSEVETKRDFIVNRIDELAKKFPRTAMDQSHREEDTNPKLNEIALSEVKTLRGNIKSNQREMDEKKSRLNAIINKDKKNKRDLKHIERITRYHL